MSTGMACTNSPPIRYATPANCRWSSMYWTIIAAIPWPIWPRCAASRTCSKESCHYASSRLHADTNDADVQPAPNVGLHIYTSVIEKSQSKQPAQISSRTIREKVLGPEHPDTVNSLNNLRYLLNQMGDSEAACPYYERWLAIQQKNSESARELR